MRHVFRAAALCIAGTLVASCVAADGRVGNATPAAHACSEAVLAAAATAAETRLRDAMSRLSVPGAQLAASCGGRIVLGLAIGVADVEQRVPMAPDARLRVGSVSKALTATALAQLAAEGRLDLDAPLGERVANLPVPLRAVTPRQLATHLSGIRHYDADGVETQLTAHVRAVADALPLFTRDPLLFEPGTAFHYSSYGYTLLSAAMEAADGRPFLQLLRERVLESAGLRVTVEDDVRRVIPGRARHYHVEPTGLENAWLVDPSYKWAAGGYLSSAEDLVRFASRLLDGTLVDRRALELMFTSGRTADGVAPGYGLGFIDFAQHLAFRRARGDDAYVQRMSPLAARIGEEPLRFHNGSAMGGEAHLLVAPCRGIAVAIAWNRDEAMREQFEVAIDTWRDLLAAAPARADAPVACGAERP